MFGPSQQEWTFQGWNWEAFAAVSLGALVHHPALHAVAMDYFQGALGGVKILREQGCRRIALIVDSSLEARTGHRWRGGYLAGMEGKGRIYPGNTGDAADLKQWARAEKIDGALTISLFVKKSLHSLPIRWVFLNNLGPDGVSPCLALDPAWIGSEGVRLLHHLLLRKESGLPTEPKMTTIMGSWKNLPPC